MKAQPARRGRIACGTEHTVWRAAQDGNQHASCRRARPPTDFARNDRSRQKRVWEWRGRRSFRKVASGGVRNRFVGDNCTARESPTADVRRIAPPDRGYGINCDDHRGHGRDLRTTRAEWRGTTISAAVGSQARCPTRLRAVRSRLDRRCHDQPAALAQGGCWARRLCTTVVEYAFARVYGRALVRLGPAPKVLGLDRGMRDLEPVVQHRLDGLTHRVAVGVGVDVDLCG